MYSLTKRWTKGSTKGADWVPIQRITNRKVRHVRSIILESEAYISITLDKTGQTPEIKVQIRK